MRRRRWATARRCSTPMPPARPGWCRTCTCAAPTTMRPAWRSWRSTASAITTEFENVPAPSLAWLATQRPVAPRAEAVAICQQRAAEKAHFLRSGVPCAPHALIDDDARLLQALDPSLLPGILKTAQLGYDGKGQRRVARRAELRRRLGRAAARALRAGKAPAAAPRDQRHRRARRRRAMGAPAGAAEPAPRRHPGGHAGAGARRRRRRWPRRRWSRRRAWPQSMDYVGVLCVEFFVLADGSLVANEMAPRPHNSGHYSIDACDVSQFELQVRCMAGLPLVAPRQHSRGGDAQPAGRPVVRGGEAASAPPAGPACWRCPACTCTCTARPRRGAGARWGT